MTSAVLKTSPEAPLKRSFRQQMHLAREDAIVSAVNRLLAEKGFDAMTVDEVAAEVGIAKASLYKHFPSKEDLAAAAMVRVMDRARAFLDSLEARTESKPIEQLRAVARWTMEVQLAGEMPSLPSENSSLRASLTTNKAYVDGLMDVSERLGGWITQAQADGSLNSTLPAIGGNTCCNRTSNFSSMYGRTKMGKIRKTRNWPRNWPTITNSASAGCFQWLSPP